MSSGVKINDKVKRLYEDMQVVKTDSDQNKRIRLATFHIEDSEIKVKKVYCEQDLVEEPDLFEVLVAQFDPDQPCYILYDCHFETKESSKKEELVFMMWCDDNAPIKKRMCYASSKNALKATMKGIKHDVEFHCLSECCTREAFADKLRIDTVTIEGRSVSCGSHHGGHGSHHGEHGSHHGEHGSHHGGHMAHQECESQVKH